MHTEQTELLQPCTVHFHRQKLGVPLPDPYGYWPRPHAHGWSSRPTDGVHQVWS